MPATPLWLASLEALLNRQLAMRSESAALTQRLSGKSLQVDVDGVTRIRAVTAGTRLVLLPGDDSPCDAVLSGTVKNLAQMAAGVGSGVTRDRLAGGGGSAGIQVRGDAEVAAAYRELLSLARPDWEEELSRLVGDLPAHRAARLARDTSTWLRRAARSMGENLAEYLQEESRDLVGRTEVEEFLHGVDELREAGDRLEARLQRLELKLAGTDRHAGTA
jgi:ubiquinone biosynthesis protein UbiJ